MKQTEEKLFDIILKFFSKSCYKDLYFLHLEPEIDKSDLFSTIETVIRRASLPLLLRTEYFIQTSDQKTILSKFPDTSLIKRSNMGSDLNPLECRDGSEVVMRLTVFQSPDKLLKDDEYVDLIVQKQADTLSYITSSLQDLIEETILIRLMSFDCKESHLLIVENFILNRSSRIPIKFDFEKKVENVIPDSLQSNLIYDIDLKFVDESGFDTFQQEFIAFKLPELQIKRISDLKFLAFENCISDRRAWMIILLDPKKALVSILLYSEYFNERRSIINDLLEGIRVSSERANRSILLRSLHKSKQARFYCYNLVNCS